MSKKNKLTVIEVKVVAPLGYKPRTQKYKFVVLTNRITASIRTKYENKAIDFVKDAVESTNPDIALGFSASSKSSVICGVLESED